MLDKRNDIIGWKTFKMFFLKATHNPAAAKYISIKYMYLLHHHLLSSLTSFFHLYEKCIHFNLMSIMQHKPSIQIVSTSGLRFDTAS